MSNVLCNGITITEQIKKGILGGPHTGAFTFEQDGINYTVSVEQMGVRRISITSPDKAPMEKYFQLFIALDMLLMIADGEFVPICSAVLLQEGKESTSEELNEWIKQRLGLFYSADFTRGSHSTFINIEAVLTTEIFSCWIQIREELDILHQMVMYSMADTGLPIDCKCSSIIESFEALSELIHQRVPSFTLPRVNEGESKLGKRIDAVIQAYGQDIFSAEYAKNKDAFINILVNSRNRIAHIKSRQEKAYLSGPESVLFAVKLSFLYRRVILELLGVVYSTYQETVKKSIQRWNNWNGILDEFLNKLD